ncbi:MAG: virion core protein, partial [Oscillospiraceae bacterium]|nr:virion core protein [Oscillospiraceae bacterium]
MSKTLDEEWNELRGIEICSVGIASISYDDESKKLINMRNQGAMMSNATIREGFVQSSVAQGLQNAGSNTGNMGGFVAMGMGMNAAGGFMQAASQTNAQQMAAEQAAAQQQQQPANGWTCKCGTVNTGNFCTNCGEKKPAASGSWKCSCGTENTGNFCTNCGSKKPASDEWTCSCGTVNKGNFCNNCGAKRP